LPIGSSQKGRRHAQAGRRPRGQLEPGPTVTDRNDRIRELAYFLWLEEGCLEGAAERHWLAAETLIEAELREASASKASFLASPQTIPQPPIFRRRHNRKRICDGFADLIVPHNP
jgi:hypothetical protein